MERLLNDLIGSCRGDAMALHSAANVVVTRALHDRLVVQLRRRQMFVSELSSAVRSLGCKPATRTSTFARARVVLRDIRAAIAGNRAGDAYVACTRVGARTEAAYAAALRNRRLPADARELLERQHREIVADRDELRAIHSLN